MEKPIIKKPSEIPIKGELPLVARLNIRTESAVGDIIVAVMVKICQEKDEWGKVNANRLNYDLAEYVLYKLGSKYFDSELSKLIDMGLVKKDCDENGLCYEPTEALQRLLSEIDFSRF